MSTKYEVILEDNQTGEKLLLIYVNRTSRSYLWNVLANRKDELIALGAVSVKRAGKAREGLTLENADGSKTWTMKYSGRTRLEAKASELPFICDVVTVAEEN
jgi:hypothetical protein